MVLVQIYINFTRRGKATCYFRVHKRSEQVQGCNCWHNLLTFHVKIIWFCLVLLLGFIKLNWPWACRLCKGWCTSWACLIVSYSRWYMLQDLVGNEHFFVKTLLECCYRTCNTMSLHVHTFFWLMNIERWLLFANFFLGQVKRMCISSTVGFGVIELMLYPAFSLENEICPSCYFCRFVNALTALWIPYFQLQWLVCSLYNHQRKILILFFIYFYLIIMPLPLIVHKIISLSIIF